MEFSLSNGNSESVASLIKLHMECLIGKRRESGIHRKSLDDRISLRDLRFASESGGDDNLIRSSQDPRGSAILLWSQCRGNICGSVLDVSHKNMIERFSAGVSIQLMESRSFYHLTLVILTIYPPWQIYGSGRFE